MIEKIVEIRNIGRFRDYTAKGKGDVAFCSLNLIYAENGRGKTTLCSILRSLQTGQAELIAERKTLGTRDTPVVHLRLNNSSYKFNNGAWTAKYSDILIFDSVFVNENVFSGDFVEHEHKKNLYRVIVGAQGVQLAKHIEELDGQIREANTGLRIKKDAVSSYLPSGTTLEDYLQWHPIADIEERIQKKTEEIRTRLHSAAKSGEIQTKGFFNIIQIPRLPADFFHVFYKQLINIVTDADAKVHQHITQHQMGNKGETWLSQGLDYIRDDKCPFCEQYVLINEMIEAYRSHFNEEYRNLKQEVIQLSKSVDEAIGEIALGSLQQTISDNATLVEFWKQFIEVDIPVISFPQI